MQDIRRVPVDRSVNQPTTQTTAIKSVKPKRKKFWPALTLFVILILGLLAAAVFFGKANVSVVLKQQETPFKYDFKVITNLQTDLSAETNFVVGELANEKFSDSKVFASTGTGIFGTKAKGDIKFSNICGVARTLSKGAMVTWTETGKMFVVQESVTLEPAGSTGDTKPVSLEAEFIGSAYNAPNNQTWKTDSSCVSGASNPGVTTGGESHSGSKILQSDIDKAVKSFKTELFGKSRLELSQKVSGDMVFLPELASYTVESYKTTPAVNKEGKKYTLDLTINIKVVVFKKSDLEALLVQNVGLNPDKIISGIKDLRYEVIKLDTTKNAADLSSEGIMLQVTDIDEGELRQDLNFKNDAAITAHIVAIDGVESVSVEPASLFSFSFLPKRSENITVVVSNAE